MREWSASHPSFFTPGDIHTFHFQSPSIVRDFLSYNAASCLCKLLNHYCMLSHKLYFHRCCQFCCPVTEIYLIYKSVTIIKHYGISAKWLIAKKSDENRTGTLCASYTAFSCLLEVSISSRAYISAKT